MTINWDYKAKLLWPILVGMAKDRQVKTYGDLAPMIGTNALSMRYALGKIQDYCMENGLLPLTVIVVNALTHLPGDGFIAWDVDNIKDANKVVFDMNWSELPNPFELYDENNSEDDYSKKLFNGTLSHIEKMRLVKVRGVAQSIFRRALIEAYDCKCAFCGLSFEKALEAAHIEPWALASDSNKLAVTNGILLCSTHHRLFDCRVVDFDKKHKIVFTQGDDDLRFYTVMDRVLSSKLHGKKMHLPSDKINWPRTDLCKS